MSPGFKPVRRRLGPILFQNRQTGILGNILGIIAIYSSFGNQGKSNKQPLKYFVLGRLVARPGARQ
jgi:hypothetical protein